MHDELTEWWNRISLRTKITGVTVLLLTMGLLVAGVGTMAVLRNYLQDELDAKITAAFQDLRVQFAGTPDDPQCTFQSLPNDFFLAVLNHNGRTICNNREDSLPRPLVDSLNLVRVASS